MKRKRGTALALSVLAVLLLFFGAALTRRMPTEVVWLPIQTPALTPAPTPAPTPVPTPEPTPTPRAALDYEAEELSASLAVSIEGQSDVARLTDADYNTKLTLPEGTAITLWAESEISALYMIWDRAPAPWFVYAEEFVAGYGEQGFLHEFAELPEGTQSLKIQLPQGGVLCDIYAFTDGRLPEEVQLWESPVERADILLFPTHGDDELLFFGPIMPIYAGERGLSVQVAYLTNHRNEPYRQHEQLNGLWTVGVTAYPVFGRLDDYKFDSLQDALYYYGQDVAIEFQVEMIRRFRPQVIVDHAESGEYGHGVHQMNTFCMKKAVEYAADENYDGGSLATYGVWNTPKLYLHALRTNNISLDYDRPLERFGGRSAFEMAEEGYAQHLSQHRWSFVVYPKGHAYDCSSFGLYRSTVGEDLEKNDLMENLTPYAEP